MDECNNIINYMSIRMTNDSMSESDKNQIRLSNISDRVFKNLYSKWDQSIIIISKYSENNPDMHIFLDGEFCNPNFTGQISDMTPEHQKTYRNSTNQLFQSLVLDPDVLQLSLSEEHIDCDLIIMALNREHLNNVLKDGIGANYEGLELSIGDEHGDDCGKIGFYEFRYDTILNHEN